MPIQTINDIQLHYQHLGCEASSGLPLLMLAGMASDSASWLPVTEQLNTAHELVIPDNRCTGRTLPNPVTTNKELMVEDLVALLDALQLERVNVLGHSMGGMLGWALAAAHPARVNTLVCASALPSIVPARVSLFKSLCALRSDRNEAEWFELLYQFLFSPAFFEDKSTVDTAVAQSIGYPYKQSREAFARQADALISFLSPVDIHAVQCRVTMITGSNDILMTPALMKHFCLENTQLRCHVIPDAAHAIHWEQPSAFLAVVEHALANTEPD